jgi:membrane protease YdiL (CAAX protease family)
MNDVAMQEPLLLSSGAAAPDTRSFGRRFLEATALVAAWIALGFAFHLGANAYLVLGVPLAVAFQLGVARRPLRAAWVRAAPPFRRDRVGIAAALAFASFPASALLQAIPARDLASALWSLAGAAGAFGLVYALRNIPPERRAKDFGGALLASVPGLVLMIGVALLRSTSGMLPHFGLAGAAIVFGVSLGQYLPVCFAMEEVVFRGVLDPHVARPEDGAVRRWSSAIVLSMLWGLWHLPLVCPAGTTLATAGALAAYLAVTHGLIGVGLAILWRKTGSLAAPAFAHALIDAVRNAVLGG